MKKSPSLITTKIVGNREVTYVNGIEASWRRAPKQGIPKKEPPAVEAAAKRSPAQSVYASQRANPSSKKKSFKLPPSEVDFSHLSPSGRADAARSTASLAQAMLAAREKAHTPVPRPKIGRFASDILKASKKNDGLGKA